MNMYSKKLPQMFPQDQWSVGTISEPLNVPSKRELVENGQCKQQ